MLSGRLWDGKVKVIQAITALLQSAGEKLAAEWAKTSAVQQVRSLYVQIGYDACLFMCA